MNVIETVNLTKYYGKSRGIINLNLCVEQGEFFGFIGPNGAGKSTAIRTLLGLTLPTSGRARIFGKDISKEHKSILRKVGYLPSETAFYRGMRVREILEFSSGLRNISCSEYAGSLCERLRLDTSQKADELSFGSRKKAAIVCALQHRPELLILDEPTSGLDPLMQREFFTILHELNKNGTTIFMSSHILSEIQRSCNRAAIIREGQIIACASVDALAKTNARRVSVRGNITLNGLAGVRDVNRTDGGVSFLYSGDVNSLLHTLSAGQVSDLTVSEPDLEEIFLHYYEKG